jgi:hypothetical protein
VKIEDTDYFCGVVVVEFVVVDALFAGIVLVLVFLCFLACFLGVVAAVLDVDVVVDAFEADVDDMLDVDDVLSAANAAPPMAAAKTMAGIATFKVRIHFSFSGARAPARRGRTDTTGTSRPSVSTVK